MIRGVGGRAVAGIAVAVAIGGCNLDTSGIGAGDPQGPGQDAESESEGTASEGTAGSVGEGTGSATSGVDETAEGPPSETVGGGHPAVIISDGPSYDFGSIVRNSHLDHEFTITNEGDADATALQVAVPAGPFVLMGTDCGETLAADDSCTATVRFGPLLFGDHGSELSLAFEDAGMPAAASRPFTGRGIGTTGNLVVNGGGEDSGLFDIPPDGWSDGSGGFNWATSSAVDPVEGNRTLFSAAAFPVASASRLYQQIEVASLTQWSDAGGLTFHFSAHHRAQDSNNDPTTVVLRFLSSTETDLGTYPSGMNSSTMWIQEGGDWVAPSGTVFVRVELVCNWSNGTHCNGHFDEVTLTAEWQG